MNEEFKRKIIDWLDANAERAAMAVDPTEHADEIAEDIEAQLNGRLYRFPANMPLAPIKQVREEITALIAARIRHYRKAAGLDGLEFDS